MLLAFAGTCTCLTGGNILQNGDLIEKDASGFAAGWGAVFLTSGLG